MTNSPDDNNEQEFYEAPPTMTVRDTVGVVVAVIALIVIGGAGYIWLTPDENFAAFYSPNPPPSAQTVTPTPAPAASGQMTTTSLEEMESAMIPAETESSTPAIANAPEEAEAEADPIRCEYCGMFADKSASFIMSTWGDGLVTHHDCWDCAVYHGRDNGLELDSAQVVSFIDFPDQVWIDADKAWYLYDTDVEITGSMLPYTAAFQTFEQAEEKQAIMGGEVVGFDDLLNKWTD